MIYWFTGQPGHGKTVLAKALKEYLEVNYPTKTTVFHVDGDDLRDLTENKDYSRKGREANIERAQNIAQYLNNKGYDVVVSLVAPYENIRQSFKNRMGSEIAEFYVYTSEVRGREHFHSDDYEVPKQDFLSLDTTDTPVEASLIEIINYLKI
jgi:adenylylsulfate kinase-like enzyme